MTTDRWFIFAIIGLAAVTGILAIVLFIIGCRGRRTDDHPLCRRCGYDLSGRPEGSVRCPECGADLSARRAIRVGHTRRRRVPLAIACVLFMTLLAAGTGVGAAVARGVKWTEHKPLWWLLADADSTDRVAREAAQDLIDRRRLLKQWSPEQTRAIFARALDHHADRSRPWEGFWADTVEWSLSDQSLPDDQWRRYAQQALPTVAMRARAKVERGRPLPFDFVGRDGRFTGDMSGLELRGMPQDRTVWIDGIELSPAGEKIELVVAEETRSWTRELDLGPLLGRLSDGPHTLRVRQRFVIVGGSGAGGSRVGESRWKEVGEQVVDQSVVFDLLPTGTPSIQRRADDSLRVALERFFKPNRVDIRKRLLPVSEREAGGRLVYSPDGPAPATTPLSVALSVAVRYDGREWPLSEYHWPAGEEAVRYGMYGPAKGMPADASKVDIVFRPDAAAVSKTVNEYEMWGGEIVIHDVLLYDEEDGYRDPEIRRLIAERQRAAREDAIRSKRSASRPTTTQAASRPANP